MDDFSVSLNFGDTRIPLRAYRVPIFIFSTFCRTFKMAEFTPLTTFVSRQNAWFEGIDNIPCFTLFWWCMNTMKGVSCRYFQKFDFSPKFTNGDFEHYLNSFRFHQNLPEHVMTFRIFLHFGVKKKPWRSDYHAIFKLFLHYMCILHMRLINCILFTYLLHCSFTIFITFDKVHWTHQLISCTFNQPHLNNSRDIW